MTARTAELGQSAVDCCAPLGAPALSEEEATATAGLFGALADPHRVRIVNLLAYGCRMAEDELLAPLGLSQPSVSYHLKKLTEAGLLDREQQGRRALFPLNREAVQTLAAVTDLKARCC
jgi:ArsR family transcriptional regulator